MVVDATADWQAVGVGGRNVAQDDIQDLGGGGGGGAMHANG